MSGQATGWVLRHGPKERAMRSVLLTISDAANPDGEHAHPGLSAIIRGSLYGRSHVLATLRKLIDQGWVVVEGTRERGKATVYAIPGVLDKGWAPNEVQPVDEPLPNEVQSKGAMRSNPRPNEVQSEPIAPCSSTVKNNVENNVPCPSKLGRCAEPLPAVVTTSPHLADAVRLCADLANSLRQRGEAIPEHTPTSKGWVQPMEAMLRLDGRDPEDVAAAIRWLHRGADSVASFWKSNIRSPEKLRSQFARMAEQLAAARKGGAKAAALHGPDSRPLLEELADFIPDETRVLDGAGGSLIEQGGHR